MSLSELSTSIRFMAIRLGLDIYDTLRMNSNNFIWHYHQVRFELCPTLWFMMKRLMTFPSASAVLCVLHANDQTLAC